MATKRPSNLNREQGRAVKAAGGPVMIMAGPGTGKTKTLTARIAYLILSNRAKPKEILALTFTKKAAEEMSDRIEALVPGARPEISTFHALCHKLLGQKTAFITEVERLQTIKSLPRPKSLRDLGVRELGLVISRVKNGIEMEDTDVAKVVRTYNKALRDQGQRDFDDLLVDAHDLLKSDSIFRRKIQAKYNHILVDEFQDTNNLQYEILRLLLGHENIFVIGDPNQSIYGFRGASGTIFDQFRQDFSAFKQIMLAVNYRSTKEVVRLANALFDNTLELTANTENSGQVRVVEVLNEYGEANWVLSEIQKSIGGGDFLKAISDDSRVQHRKLGDFAVLYRSRPAAIVFQKLLADSGLPYQVVGDGSPYDQPQIQAIIALFKAGANQEKVQLEGYSSSQKRLLEAELSGAEQAVPSVLAEKIIDILGFEPSLELKQFTGVLIRFKDLPSALNYFDSIAESGFYDASADAITLLTIHASKGLEFPQVFLIGAEEGILPSFRGEEDEEKRLFYVAATRAREKLEITYARNRGGQKAEPSRFVRDLSDQVLKRHIDPDIENQIRRIAKRAAKNSQTKLF